MQHKEHALHRQYVRDRNREDYAKDIIQPYKSGQVNPDFVEAWGKNDPYTRELVGEKNE